MKDQLKEFYLATREVVETQGLELASWLGQCAGLMVLVGAVVWAVQALPRPDRHVDISGVPGLAFLESRGALIDRLAVTQGAAVQLAEEKGQEAQRAATLGRENAKMRAELGSWQTAVAYSSIYNIKADMAKDIVDASKQAGIDHDLAFRLINVESQFHERATSPVGARGLTQVMPGYRGPAPHVNPDSLYSRRINLRVGLSFLRNLLDQYHGNTNLALVAYNRGPVKMDEALKACKEGRGCRLSNGYDRAVLTSGPR